MDAIKEGMLASAKAAEAAARIGERLFCQNTPNVMNFNSQICTSREQSERLLALGLKKETADMGWVKLIDGDGYVMAIAEDYSFIDIPAWSLGRLLELSYGDVHPNNVVRISAHNPFEDMIKTIEGFIKHQCFNKEYLENGNC